MSASFSSVSPSWPQVTGILRCPTCGQEHDVIMPTDACQIVFTCTACQTVLRPQPGDCCVFCSYGSVPCPPIQVGTRASSVAHGNTATIPCLHQTLEPLITTFNALHVAPRLLALVSPTCPECVFGADMVRQVVEATPLLQALVVWLPMLERDTPAAIDHTAARFMHPRIHRFADPHQLAGTYIASRLGDGDWIAWDCYLRYLLGDLWEEDLPMPDQWFHQLDGHSADLARQRCGPALLPALLERAHQVTH